jgi:uncharacterized protein YecT (DUF1311 family)
MRLAVFLVAFFAFAGISNAQEKLRAEDSRTIQDCIKGFKVRAAGADDCIGRVANLCQATEKGRSTSGQAECYRREQLVWDDILNETYRRVQQDLDERKRIALRDAQRAWLESRKLGCGFYHTFIEGTLAIPISASCFNRETAQRALYLLFFQEYGN